MLERDVRKVAGSLRGCEGWCDVEFLQWEASVLVPLTGCHGTLVVDNESVPCYHISPCHMNRIEDNQIIIFIKLSQFRVFQGPPGCLLQMLFFVESITFGLEKKNAVIIIIV